MAVAQLQTKTMIDVYDDLRAARPKSFLKSFFRVRPENIKNSLQVELDVIRAGKRVAIDVIMGAGPRMNKSGRFTTKLFTPPLYDEADAVTAVELFNRLPGNTPYSSKDKMAKLFALIARKQIELTYMIERAWELQAAQALTTGKITLTNAINGSIEIDFGLRATHQASASASWATASTDVIGDIIALGIKIRQDSHYMPEILVTRGNVIEDILSNTEINKRLQQIRNSRETFQAPEFMGQGGVFHGRLSAGDNNLQLWSYDETYDTDAVANNYYIPDNTVILLSSQARYDAIFAGIPVLLPAKNDPVAKAMNLPAIPAIAAGEIVPYYNLDWKKRSLIAGVASRPIMIPTAIDSFGTIDVS